MRNELICETCAHYDTDRNDQPCYGCVDGINWESAQPNYSGSICERGEATIRNPDRIQNIMILLQRGWEKVPDWRFGQLIENLKRYVGVDDLFYIEDERLTEQIIDFFDLG